MKTHTIHCRLIVAFIAVLAVLALCMAACTSPSPRQESVQATLTEHLALADNALVVTKATSVDANLSSVEFVDGVYYLVKTPAQLKYALTNDTTNTFLLMNDFVIEDDTWCNRTSATELKMTISGKGYEQKDGKWVETGSNHSITFHPNKAVDSTVISSSTYGGLFGNFGGTLTDLTYIFEGKLEVGDKDTVYYGGLAGILSGTIKDCIISYAGTIDAYGNADGRTVYVGGVAGQMKGATITDTIFSMAGVVYARNMKNEGDQAKAKNCNMYAGGLAGLSADSGTNAARATTLTRCVISSSTTVYSADMGSDTVGNNFVASPNDNGKYFIAGGLVGYAHNFTCDNSTIKLTGKAISLGGVFAAADGAGAGGLFGLTASGAKLNLRYNVITLGGMIRSENGRKSGNLLTGIKMSGDTVSGGIIGRMQGAPTSGGFIRNAIFLEADIVFDDSNSNGKDTEGKNYYGYLVGVNNGFNSFNGGGNWVVYRGGMVDGKPTEYIQKIPMRQTTNSSGGESNSECGNVGTLLVYGGGNVQATIDKTNTLIFTAKPQYSPFYKWLRGLGGNNALTGREVNDNTFTPDSGTSGVVYAAFLTQKIYDAGNYVQWTEEMNTGLNFAWNSVTLEEDIFVEKGVNLLNTYAGTFHGNNHTITFGSGVVMYRNATSNPGDEVVGLFGEVSPGATVENLNVVFAGTIYGGNQDIKDPGTDYDDSVTMGLLAGINHGTFVNLNVTISQAARLLATAQSVKMGGLVGLNDGTLAGVTLAVDGTLQSNADTVIVGGVIAEQAAKSEEVVFERFNVDLRGQLIARDKKDGDNDSVTCRMGGFIGVSNAALRFRHVAVNVRDLSNFGGDVLSIGCAHNIAAYDDVVAELDFALNTNTTVTNLTNLREDLADLKVALASQASYNQILSELDACIANGVAATAASHNLADTAYYSQYIKSPILGLDCGAPCSACASTCHTAIFVSELGTGLGYGLNNTWTLSSFMQYPDHEPDYTSGVSTRVLSYFGANVQTTEEVQPLNFIFVRNGSAVVAEIQEDGGMVFSVPLDDDSHVFTGWYSTFDQDEMVDSLFVTSREINGKTVSCFIPTNGQSSKVFYSSVIANLISSASELNYLATTTRAGQRYEGTTFSLGNDITITGSFLPIGSSVHPFGGVLDGKLHTITFKGGFDLQRVAEGEGLGLFGGLDSTAVVRQLTVVYAPNNISNYVDTTSRVFGGVAGFNRGVIGDSRQEDVNVIYLASVSGASLLGGVVGQNENEALVQNVVVTIGSGIDDSFNPALVAPDDGIVGGVVAHNALLGKVRNAQVRVLVAKETLSQYGNYEGTMSAGTCAGGLVGHNEGRVYSGVVNVTFETKTQTLASADQAGILIGSNGANADIDSLWALYTLPTKLGNDNYVLPAMQSNGSYVATLINGTDADKGNRLISYGHGSIKAEVYANMEERQPKGGSIVFEAVKDATETPFYGFTMTLAGGEAVENASGEKYSPQVASLTNNPKPIAGQDCFAVFVDSQINSKEELYALAKLVNGGFQAYANYIIKLTGTTMQLWPTDEGYATIGTAEYPFVGTFDGNNYVIELRSAGDSCKPLFGVIGATSSVRNLEYNINEAMTVTDSVKYDGIDAVGLLACVNLGTINSVHLTTESSVAKDGAAVGALVGYNKGTINGTTSVVMETVNYAGQDIASSVRGQYAGAIVGYNAGVVGSDMIAGVTATIADGTVQAFVQGSKAAGGIVGENHGTIKGVLIDLLGKVYGANQTGAIAGISYGSIGAATVTIGSKATFALGDNLPDYAGGIVGVNEQGGKVGVGSSTVRVTWAAPATLKVFGGAAGRNNGAINNASITFNASVTGTTVGGMVGEQYDRLETSELQLNQSATLSGNIVGGIIGAFGKGYIRNVSGSIYGVLQAGANGGGMVGKVIAEDAVSVSVNTCYVTLSNDIAGQGSKGLAIGSFRNAMATNSWVVASNRIRTLAAPNGQKGSGFNVLKIVGNASVVPSFVTKDNSVVIRLTAEVLSGWPLLWYQDISALMTDGYTDATYDADPTLKDVLYHVCYYDLFIGTAEAFYNMYLSVNAADLFNGVMFCLNADIEINGQMLQPIGTATNAFTGIFEGNYKTITLKEGSGIAAGSDYSGLFGVIASTAIVRNFILNIEEGVLLGSTCLNVGGLAGRIDGTVSNVAVHLGSNPASKLDNAKIGALAGVVSEGSHFENTWVVIYNDGAPRVGEGSLGGDANFLNVLGGGKMSVTMDPVLLREDVVQFIFDVVGGLQTLDAWYTDITTRKTFAKATAEGSELGVYSPTAEEHGILDAAAYRPNRALTGSNFTLSFFSLVIRNAQDFYNFASNINQYGDQGAYFTMDLGKEKNLTIDASQFNPIGTRSHPFTGTFDGSVPDKYGYASRVYEIIVQGNFRTYADQEETVKNDYSGLFGNVGNGATIQNLIIRADASLDDNGQVIGHQASMYTGFVASYLANGSKIKNLVAFLDDNTHLINIHDDAVGGLVGVMAKGAQCDNVWIVLPENSTVHPIGGYSNGGILPYDDIAGVLQEYAQNENSLTQQDKQDRDALKVALPAVMYLCGDGTLAVTASNDKKLSFKLNKTDEGQPTYGFVDAADPEGTKLGTGSSDSAVFVPDGTEHGKNILAIFVKDSIDNVEDLKALARMLNEQHRSYLGVKFYLNNKINEDLVVEGTDWVPIGGNILTNGQYTSVPFIGAFDGRGRTIVFKSSVTCNAAYAGLFGLLSSTARISNLRVVTEATFGGADTEYAGVIAGLDLGASLTNVIVSFEKSASLVAEIDTGRLAVNSALLYDVDGFVTNYDEVNKCSNVWVLNYNNRYNVTSNQKEQAFFDSIDPGDPSSRPQGSYGGGANSVTVVAAGLIKIEFAYAEDDADKTGPITGVSLTSTNNIKDWYSVSSNGVITNYGYGELKQEFDKNVEHMVLYASFLQDDIKNLSQLMELARDNNNGYDLYGLTFRLQNDIEIKDVEWKAIGTALTPFNAVFDGNYHTLTLNKDVVVDGVYAGIFGCLGDTGEIKNVKFDIDGTLGKITYVESDGKPNTEYAGAIAYNMGKLSSVIIDVTDATICATAYAGAAFGYDVVNYADNTWTIFNAANWYTLVGKVHNDVASTVNSMEIVGVGTIDVSFYVPQEQPDGQHYVKMSNHVDENRYAIKGWYSDFSHDYQLSRALNVTALETEVVNGNEGSYIAAANLINSRFEVVIMTTVIRNQDELIAIADDVNKGGYTFRDTVFTLGVDLVITKMDFTSIGTAETPFEGSFVGSYNGRYYTITMNRYSTDPMTNRPKYEGTALFGITAGTVTDLTVIVQSSLSYGQSTIGCLANDNRGTIQNCLVVVKPTVVVNGAITGGIAGRNSGTISNSIVRVMEGAKIKGSLEAGALVGHNEGLVQGSTGGDLGQATVWANERKEAFGWAQGDLLSNTIASVLLEGTVQVTGLVDGTNMGVGGAVGVSQGRGNLQRITVRLVSSGKVVADDKLVAVGGLVGRSTGIVANSIVTMDGELNGNVSLTGGVGDGREYVGYFAGNIQGTITNSWLVVPVPSSFKAVGNGSAVNVLQISGGGRIDSYLDSDNNIIFSNITTQGAELDGWYVGSGTAIPATVGNVDGDSFLPSSSITGWTVSVIFINTEIYTVDDLNRMAQMVNAGLFAPNLKFTLQKDIVIDKDHPLVSVIGNQDNGFKHTFDGLGSDGKKHTITFALGDNGQGTMPEGTLMGLFGYVTASAEIRNLTICIYGVNGSSATTAIGGIAGINNGRIIDCTLNLGDADTAAVLSGIYVGGLVGTNGSTARIEGGAVVNNGMLKGLGIDNRNIFVGGIAGTNAGRIINVQVTHARGKDDKNVLATADADTAWSGSAYAGGVSGNNTGSITSVHVTLTGATIRAEKGIVAYAGGVVGSNTGIIEKTYVEVDLNVDAGANVHTTVSVDNGNVGGIVGINNQGIRNSMIELRNNRSSVGDSAIGGEGVNAFADNVWVYNDDATVNSKRAQVNNMTFTMIGSKRSVTHNAASEICSTGHIIFDGLIDADLGLSVFADAHVYEGKAFDQVLLDGIIGYEDGYLRLAPVFGDNDVQGTRGIWARAEIRRSFAHETELKALSKAIRLEGQAIRNKDGVGFSLSADITITGHFSAIGTQSNPFNALFMGNLFEIVFDKDVVFDNDINALFGYVDGGGVINYLVVRHEASLDAEDAAGVVYNNKGNLNTIIVYAEEGVSITNPIVATNSGNRSNLWLINRINGVAAGDFSVITVHGSGDVVIENRVASLNAGGLVFAPSIWADVKEYTTFEGWSQDNQKLDIDGNFSATDKFGNYSAEFLSTRLESQDQFEVLLNLLTMNFDLKGKTYELIADIDFDLAAYSNRDMHIMSKFQGVLKGNFHTLKLRNAQTSTVFGTMEGGTFRDIVLDTRDFDQQTYLWSADTMINLINVFVEVTRQDARLVNAPAGTPLNFKLDRVYILTDNMACFDIDQGSWHINAANVTGGVSAIYTAHVDLIGFDNDNGIRAFAKEDNDFFFVGWETASGASIANAIKLSGDEKEPIRASFIASAIGDEQAFADLQQAVERGFDFAGKTFVLNTDLTAINAKTIAQTGWFRATLDGNGHKISWQSHSPVFGNFGGKLVNLLLIASDAPFADVAESAVIQDSVIVTDIFAVSGSISYSNAWILSQNVVTSAGANTIRLNLADFSTVDARTKYLITNAQCKFGAEIELTLQPKDVNYFLVWTDADGRIWVNDRYNTVTLSGQNKHYGTKVSNEIASSLEMDCYSVATANGFVGTVKLVRDIELDSSYQPLANAVYLSGQGHTITISDDNMCLLTDIDHDTTFVRDLRINVRSGLTKFTLDMPAQGKAAKDTKGTFNNVVIDYEGDTKIFLGDESDDYCYSGLSGYQLEKSDRFQNVWLLHKATTGDLDTMVQNMYLRPVNVLRYQGGEFEVEFSETSQPNLEDEDHPIRVYNARFEATPDYGYTFYAYYSNGALNPKGNVLERNSILPLVRAQAKFVKQNIDNAEDWNNLVSAMNDTGDVVSVGQFYLTKDLVFEGMQSLVNFSGTLDGMGNSLIIDHEISDLPWTLTSKAGTIRNLAVKLNVKPSTQLNWFAEEDIAEDQQNPAIVRYDQVWLIVGYDRGDDEVSCQGNLLVIVDSQGTKHGDFRVEFVEQEFVFYPVEELEYKLYSLEKVTTSGKTMVPAVGSSKGYQLADGKYEATFDYCYSVTIKHVITSKGEVVNDLSVKPEVKVSNASLWRRDISAVCNVEALLTEGYLFLGFSFEDNDFAITPEEDADPITVDASNCMKLKISASTLTSSVVVTANYIALTSEWESIVYGEKTPQELRSYLTLSKSVWDALGLTGLDDESAGDYEVSRSILHNLDTLSLYEWTEGEGNNAKTYQMPYHAGNYNVQFTIKWKGPGNVKIDVGQSFNLVFKIEQRELYFASITFAERNFDGTPDVNVLGMVLGGMTEEDAHNQASLVTSNIAFQYCDANGNPTSNAGNWYIKLTDQSYLDCSSDTLYYQYDYTLPKGVLYKYTTIGSDKPVRSDPYMHIINKQVLNLTVKTVSINFLDQFAEGFTAGGEININKVLADALVLDGLNNEEKEVVRNSNLLLVKGDRIEGGKYLYSLRHVGDYDIVPNSEALQNYEPRISDHTALFRILPGAVRVEIMPTSIIYGDNMTSLNYCYYREQEQEVLWSVDAGSQAAYEARFAGKFANISSYADFAAFASLDIRPVSAYDDGQEIDESLLRVGTYQVKYAVGNGRDMALASTDGYTADYTIDAYQAISAKAILTIGKRSVTYRVTTAVTKEFGAKDIVIGARAVTGGMASQDVLLMTREEGELVGNYPIKVGVYNPYDPEAAANYTLTPEREGGYIFRIVQRKVYVKRIGNNVFRYGSGELTDMPYTLSLSDEVATNIASILKVANLQAVFDIHVGYYGAMHSVGSYSDLVIKVDRKSTISEDIYTQAVKGLLFEMDNTSNHYTIVPQALTVTVDNYSRKYNNSALLYLNNSDELTSKVHVTGWISQEDEQVLELHVDSWESDIRADVGMYTYRPKECHLQGRAGKDNETIQSVMQNYTIGRIASGSYKIEKIDITVNVAIGYFDQDGSFVEAANDEVLFGDPNVQWFFSIEKMPAYFGEEYEKFLDEDEATDRSSSEFFARLLSIKAYAVSTLPVNYYISAKDGVMKDCYCQNSNIKATFKMASPITIGETKIIIEGVQLTAVSEYVRPTASFVVKAYKTVYLEDMEGWNFDGSGNLYDSKGNVVRAGGKGVLYDDNNVKYNVTLENGVIWVQLDSYLQDANGNNVSELNFSGLNNGQFAQLNQALSVQYVGNDSLGQGGYEYRMVPYVGDSSTLYEYTQNEDNAVVFVRQADIKNGYSDVISDQAQSIQVEVLPSFQEALVQNLKSNGAIIGGALAAGLVLVVGVGVLGWWLNRRRRIKNAVAAHKKQDAAVRKRK